jgi:Xaa-Pro aminopeptidase
MATPDHNMRMAAFRRQLDAAGLDGYWLTDAANVRYLCGFRGEDSTLLIAPGRSVLITDSRYVEQAEAEARVDEVVSRHTTMAQAAGAACKALGIKRLGVTSANLTHAEFGGLAAAAPALDLLPRRSGIAERMRARKDPSEVEAIRAALACAEEAFGAVLEHLEPGRSERWLAARLEYEMRTRGAEDASFDIICAVGANASVPHAVSGDAELSAGQGVLFDWGARLDGYCSDLTRMVGTGRIPPRTQALVEVVLEAQEAVFARLKPGESCADADAAGRAVIARAGYGRQFGHGMGHGVGLKVHEQPSLGPRNEAVLLPGMVVTVEPGIYLPGEVGVRVEEMALITEDGHEILTRLPRRPADLLAAAWPST